MENPPPTSSPRYRSPPPAGLSNPGALASTPMAVRQAAAPTTHSPLKWSRSQRPRSAAPAVALNSKSAARDFIAADPSLLQILRLFRRLDAADALAGLGAVRKPRRELVDVQVEVEVQLQHLHVAGIFAVPAQVLDARRAAAIQDPARILALGLGPQRGMNLGAGAVAAALQDERVVPVVVARA